jgi:hypothetical protein
MSAVYLSVGLRNRDRLHCIIFRLLLFWRNMAANSVSLWVLRSLEADNPLAITANFFLVMLAVFPKVLTIYSVFCAFWSASVSNVITTLPLCIVLAATASLLPVAVLIACIISCGVLLRSGAAALPLRTTSSLLRLAGTTILVCHAPSLLDVPAVTAAQLRCWGGV